MDVFFQDRLTHFQENVCKLFRSEKCSFSVILLIKITFHEKGEVCLAWSSNNPSVPFLECYPGPRQCRGLSALPTIIQTCVQGSRFTRVKFYLLH